MRAPSWTGSGPPAAAAGAGGAFHAAPGACLQHGADRGGDLAPEGLAGTGERRPCLPIPRYGLPGGCSSSSTHSVHPRSTRPSTERRASAVSARRSRRESGRGGEIARTVQAAPEMIGCRLGVPGRVQRPIRDRQAGNSSGGATCASWQGRSDAAPAGPGQHGRRDTGKTDRPGEGPIWEDRG